jgi:hypothetical protein
MDHHYEKPDPNPYLSENPDPNPYQSEKPDPHPHHVKCSTVYGSASRFWAIFEDGRFCFDLTL